MRIAGVNFPGAVAERPARRAAGGPRQHLRRITPSEPQPRANTRQWARQGRPG